MGKKILCFSFVISFLVCLCVSFSASEPVLPAESEAERVARLWETLDQLRYGETAASAPEFSFDLRSAVLMEASTGTVLYEYQKDERHLPASVTKVMTLLLTMEAIEAGQISEEDQVTASDYAASMGGTQIYLEVGVQMSVRDLIKSVAVPSANDAAVALAEYIAGSREAFVAMMNEKVRSLGCLQEECNFANPSGLNDENQYVSPYTMAKIGQAAFANETLMEVNAATSYQIDHTINHPDGLRVEMEHKLLITTDEGSDTYYPRAVAGKTGWTGGCWPSWA